MMPMMNEITMNPSIEPKMRTQQMSHPIYSTSKDEITHLHYSYSTWAHPQITWFPPTSPQCSHPRYDMNNIPPASLVEAVVMLELLWLPPYTDSPREFPLLTTTYLVGVHRVQVDQIWQRDFTVHTPWYKGWNSFWGLGWVLVTYLGI